MATWHGEAILVQHKCGAKFWLEAGEFFAFAVIGREWWKGDRMTVCNCGADISQFHSKAWVEA